mmetsp:Transcript_78732/g.210191  ORF Transcript_78732/g.210191 Transcript_78732/m.210191 type:complete len:665 (+) Transcript_78732:14-2008(+)
MSSVLWLQLLAGADPLLSAFVRDGFLVLPPVPLPDSVDLKRKLQAFHQPEFNDWTGQENLLAMAPELESVIDSEVVDAALTAVLGAEYTLHAFRFPSLAAPAMLKWHQDSLGGFVPYRSHFPMYAMLIYYPEAVSFDIGPTVVAPGTQYFSFTAASGYAFEDVMDNTTFWQVFDSARPPLALPVCAPRGGILIAHHDVYHAVQDLAAESDRWAVVLKFQRRTWPTAPVELVDMPAPLSQADWICPGTAPQEQQLSRWRDGGMQEVEQFNLDRILARPPVTWRPGGDPISRFWGESDVVALVIAAYDLAVAGHSDELLKGLQRPAEYHRHLAAGHGLAAATYLELHQDNTTSLQLLAQALREGAPGLNTTENQQVSVSICAIMGQLGPAGGGVVASSLQRSIAGATLRYQDTNSFVVALSRCKRDSATQDSDGICNRGDPPVLAARVEAILPAGAGGLESDVVRAALFEIRLYVSRQGPLQNKSNGGFEDGRACTAALMGLQRLLLASRRDALIQLLDWDFPVEMQVLIEAARRPPAYRSLAVERAKQRKEPVKPFPHVDGRAYVVTNALAVLKLMYQLLAEGMVDGTLGELEPGQNSWYLRHVHTIIGEVMASLKEDEPPPSVLGKFGMRQWEAPGMQPLIPAALRSAIRTRWYGQARLGILGR